MAVAAELYNFKEEVFTETVKLLHKKGYVSLEKYYVDGTKIESVANKYNIKTMIWTENEKKKKEAQQPAA